METRSFHKIGKELASSDSDIFYTNGILDANYCSSKCLFLMKVNPMRNFYHRTCELNLHIGFRNSARKR